MAKFKCVKRGVKSKHRIIEGVIPILEAIAKVKWVKKVIPEEYSAACTQGCYTKA